MAVTATHADALRAATPGDTITIGASRLVYLVVMKGTFTLNVPVPAGAREPTGSYLAITLDPATLRVLDLGLSDHAPPVPLRRFGPVSRLATG
jgi:hypothetical protein